MVEYIFEKILSYAKNFRIFEPVSIILVFLAAPISGLLAYFLQNKVEIPILTFLFGRSYDLIPAFGIDAVGLIIWFLLFVFLRWLFDFPENLYWLWLLNRQEKISIDFTHLQPVDFKKNWIIQGSPVLNSKGLIFTNSNSGCLIKPGNYWPNSKSLKKWKDFKATIQVDFKKVFHIVNDLAPIEERPSVMVWKDKKEEFRQIIGIVFGAQSLDDYYMIEVWKINDVLSFRPHVRMHGNWDAPVYNSPVNIKLKSRRTIVSLKLIVKNGVAQLLVGELGSLQWSLPTEFDANLIQHNKTEKKTDLQDAAVVNIPFNSKMGMFGFRNYGNEIAVVKSLTIEPIMGTNKSVQFLIKIGGRLFKG